MDRTPGTARTGSDPIAAIAELHHFAQRRREQRQLRNDAGIIGAAIVAVEGLSDAKSTWDDLPEGKRPMAG